MKLGQKKPFGPSKSFFFDFCGKSDRLGGKLPQHQACTESRGWCPESHWGRKVKEGGDEQVTRQLESFFSKNKNPKKFPRQWLR